MGKFSGKTCKLISVMGLVVLYFFVELFVGFFIQSLALVADAFHMLSDFIALLVGIVSNRLTKMPRTSRNTFGWQRADVVGTLINTVILSTLCFTIVVRAIERFIEVHKVHQPIVMVGVGSGGLLINLISLCILRNHGHTHGTHVRKFVEAIEVGEETSLVNPDNAGLAMEPPIDGRPIAPDDNVNTVDVEQPVPNEDVQMNHNEPNKTKGHAGHSHGGKKAKSMNMKAVFLHVMADALGSVIVVVSALILYFAPPNSKWTDYVDPGMSLVLVAIIMFSTSKLLYQSALILLQSVPKRVKFSQIKNDIESVVGSNKVHDLHIWRLQGECIIGTVHIRCNDLEDYISRSKEVKSIFHKSDIHCTTIQPEFDVQQGANMTDNVNQKQCYIECGPNGSCNQNTCCPTAIEVSKSTHQPPDTESVSINVVA